jgi:hypothetical protein
VSGELVKAREDTTIMFDLVDKAFHYAIHTQS